MIEPDRELKALTEVVELFNYSDEQTRLRVIYYLQCRYFPDGSFVPKMHTCRISEEYLKKQLAEEKPL